jgi:hypothetical protein
MEKSSQPKLLLVLYLEYDFVLEVFSPDPQNYQQEPDFLGILWDSDGKGQYILENSVDQVILKAELVVKKADISFAQKIENSKTPGQVLEVDLALILYELRILERQARKDKVLWLPSGYENSHAA